MFFTEKKGCLVKRHRQNGGLHYKVGIGVLFTHITCAPAGTLHPCHILDTWSCNSRDHSFSHPFHRSDSTKMRRLINTLKVPGHDDDVDLLCDFSFLECWTEFVCENVYFLGRRLMVGANKGRGSLTENDLIWQTSGNTLVSVGPVMMYFGPSVFQDWVPLGPHP